MHPEFRTSFMWRHESYDMLRHDKPTLNHMRRLGRTMDNKEEELNYGHGVNQLFAYHDARQNYQKFRDDYVIRLTGGFVD